METHTIGKFKYIILVLTACTLWGSAFAGAKICFEYCGPILLSAIRFTLAAVLLLPMLLLGKSKSPFLSYFKHWKFMLMFGFIQTFLQYGLFYLGLNEVPGAISAIIVGAGPVFVTLLAHFTIADDRFTTRKVISIVMGVAGILFITLSKGDFQTTDNFYFGVAMLLLSNLVGSSTNIIVAKNKHLGISPIALTAFANFSGGIMLFIAACFCEPIVIKDPNIDFFVALIWLAIIPAAGFSIWYYLLSLPNVKVSELNIWKFVVPVSGVLLSWIFLPSEQPNWREAFGIVIISISIIILNYRSRVIHKT